MSTPSVSPHRVPVLEHLATLGDQTRCRILRGLERHELMVSELHSVLQLPQSTVSRHLRVLLDGGWVRSRRDGTRHFYEASVDQLEEAARRLWALIRDEMSGSPGSEHDAQRLEAVLAERRTRSQEFFSSAAGEWDRVRDQLFGAHFDLTALVGLLDATSVIGDLACGTGRIASVLAPCVARVVAVDSSSAMLKAARERLTDFDNVDVREGALEHLPIEDGRLDAATLFLALHHVPDPARVLRESRRVLRTGGRLLVVDMTPHDRDDYQKQMGHVWLGFSEEQIKRSLALAGLALTTYRTLPPDPAAKGPTLFAATASAIASDQSARSESTGKTKQQHDERAD